MGDTTFEDPCHFYALADPYPHQEHPWCPCGTVTEYRHDYEGKWWGVRHRFGGPGGAVHAVPSIPEDQQRTPQREETPMSVNPAPTRPAVEVTLFSGAVITVWGLLERQAQSLARKLAGDGKHTVDVLSATSLFAVAVPGSDEVITDLAEASDYRSVRPAEVTAVQVTRPGDPDPQEEPAQEPVENPVPENPQPGDTPVAPAPAPEEG